MGEWITTEEAAQISGYGREHIRDLARLGKLKAKKVATVWLVSRKSLEAHIRKTHELGEKRGPKTGN